VEVSPPLVGGLKVFWVAQQPILYFGQRLRAYCTVDTVPRLLQIVVFNLLLAADVLYMTLTIVYRASRV